ncbi:MAG: hypothetical protein ABI056_00120 [Caulobacteraceae bacterium]
MKTLVAIVVAGAAVALLTGGAPATGQTYGSFAGASLGIDANTNGAVAFPADEAWNTDISAAPVDPNSDNLIASIGLATGLHADFGSGTYGGRIIGIPYVIVASSQPLAPIKFTAYADESDPGPYPVPPNAPIEGSKPSGGPGQGDRHVLVIDRDSNRLYEMYASVEQPDDSWKAASGAIFHLDSDNVRPTAKPGWTSADAAGLPIFPGLARYEEASAGLIPHALRFTVAQSRRAYVLPANHFASTSNSRDLPPMGMRVRLKASYAIPAGFSTESKAILQALKTYGMFIADNGSNWFISGAPDDRWNNTLLHDELGQVTGSDFEVVKMGRIHH